METESFIEVTEHFLTLSRKFLLLLFNLSLSLHVNSSYKFIYVYPNIFVSAEKISPKV